MLKLPLALAFCSLAVLSCAPTTPQGRIEKNPEKYESLSSRDKSLVEQGKLRKGMSKDAVLLALGEPEKRFEGYQNGSQTERWDFMKNRPVYSNGFYSGFGYGYGQYRYGRGGFGGFGYSPEIYYVPYRSASVWFKNDLVSAWEMQRN